MLHYKRLVTLLAVAVVGSQAVPQDADNNLEPRVLSADKSNNGLYNVFFIPAYRLTTNKTYGRTPEPVTRPPLHLDPRVSARLVTAALTAAVRNATAARNAQAGQRLRAPPAPPAALKELPPQRHDAHILVTVTTPSNPSGQQQGQQRQPLPGYHHFPTAFGHSSAHHFNNYPSHLAPNAYYPNGPALYGHGHFGPYGPAPIPVPPNYHQSVSGTQNQPRYNAAASAVDVVSSAPIGVSTTLGTTGPVYATVSQPASTTGRAGGLTTLFPTTLQPDTTMPQAEKTTASSAASSASYASTLNNDTEPIKEKFEFTQTNQRQKLNISAQVEVTSVEVTPPTAANEPETEASGSSEKPTSSPTPSPTKASSALEAKDTRPPTSPGPGSHPPPHAQQHPHPHPAVFQVPNGFALGGFNPGDYSDRYSTHPPLKPPSNDPFPREGRLTHGSGFGALPNQLQFNTNPTYSGQFFPFYDSPVPGFAPGYPFGVSPTQDVRNAYPVHPDTSHEQGNPGRDTRPAPSAPATAAGSDEDRSKEYDQAPPRQQFVNGPRPGKPPHYPFNHPFQQGGEGFATPSPFVRPLSQPQQNFNQNPQPLSPAQEAYTQNRQPFAQTGQPFTQNQQPFPQNQQPFTQNVQPFPQNQQPFPANQRPFPNNQQPFSVNPEYNRFTDDFYSNPNRQRFPVFYTGPLPNQQSPAGSPDPRAVSQPGYSQQASPSAFGQPFGFVNQFYATANERTEPVAGQTQLTSYATGPGEKLVSTRYDVKGNDVLNGVLGGVVGALTATHRLARREDQVQRAKEFGVGFYGPKK